MASFTRRISNAARVLLGRGVPAKEEIGATGTPIFGGVLNDSVEYLSDLRGSKGYTMMDKMRRSDGQVKGALLACELPFHSAYWDIKPGTPDRQGAYIADAVRENLFENMTITWEDVLHHIMLMLPFGCMVLEKCWELDSGMWVWRKWAPRLPSTITEWHVDDTGGLAYVTQQAWNKGTMTPVDIPVEKILVFTNEREGSNYAGISLLRAAYKHWWYKNTLYAIDGIAAERHGMGMAYFSYPPGATTDQKDAIKAVGERLHAHERAYVALPNDIAFDLKGVTGQLHDIKGSIEHHDQQIARSILAQFMMLGTGSTGSFALSEDQSGFFLMALKAIGKGICNTINRYAIREMVDYNWEVQRYPKLDVSDLDSFDVVKMADAVTKLATAGVIMPDEHIEAELRRKMRLPARRAKVEQPQAGQGQEPGAETPPAEQLSERRLTLWEPRRALIGCEQHIAFSDINDKLNNTADEFIKAVGPWQQKQISKIVGRVAAAIENNDVERIPTIDVPYHKEMAAEIERVLSQIYDYGKQQVKDEYAKQRGGVRAAEERVPQPAPKALIKTRALAMASILSNKLRAAVAWEAIRQARGGTVDTTELAATLLALSNTELRNTATFSATEAFNLGRQAQAAELKNKIVRITSSALMDDNTCPFCTSYDGDSWTPGDAVTSKGKQVPKAEPPYQDCDGQDRCRCLWVYTFASEV